MLTGRIPRGGSALGRAVREAYVAGQTDYSLEPIVLTDHAGHPLGRIRDGDAVIFCCRRGEREVQLTEAFTGSRFDRFPRAPFQDLKFVILTLYHEKFRDLPVAFAPLSVSDTLSEVISRAGLRQLHVAESEKYAHVTFFFNGGNSQPFEGERDIRIPSPQAVPFDQVPELSLAQVAQQVCAGIAAQSDFILTNFANGDVIGHTANAPAKVRCAAVVDFWLGQVVDAALAGDYAVFITADHGNLEEMINPDGSPHVAHTINPVQFIALDPRAPFSAHGRAGRLADVAPTILAALGIPRPAAMDGAVLTPLHDWGGPRRALLIILDGWGIGRQDATNPILLADTPVWDRLLQTYPSSRLEAAGEAVGLQPGKAGNSEAGHMNLGAGRVIRQDDVRLDQAMQDGTFYTNPILCRTIADATERRAGLHLLGLLTERSSHGSIHYPLAILRMARERGLKDVYLHMILDGRSTEPGSAPALLEGLECQLDEIGTGQVVSSIGRGIALDRDGNYARTRQAYEALVYGRGTHFAID